MSAPRNAMQRLHVDPTDVDNNEQLFNDLRELAERAQDIFADGNYDGFPELWHELAPTMIKAYSVGEFWSDIKVRPRSDEQ